MTVIAMSQEMGTLGKDVAAGVATALHLKLVRHEIGDEAAERMNVRRSLIRRFREGQAGWLESRRVDRESLALHTAEQVYELALEGDVLIRGWGATMLLFPVRHVPCIRVCAPMEQRVRWLMERLDTDDETLARDEIERSDTAHAARIRQIFDVTLGDPLLYDLVLNTGRVTIPSCVEQVVALARRPEFEETEASRAQLADLALAARVRTALRGSAPDGALDVAADTRGSSVTLRGMVMNEDERALAERVTAGVAGVTEIDNQLRVIRPTHRYTRRLD